MSNPRIAILTLVIGADYRRDLAACLESKRAYATKHGYTYIQGDEEFWDRERPIAWSKILFWQHVFRERAQEFDFFWISDADVYITNPELRLEEHVLPLMPAQADLMWNMDACKNLNSGNMIFRANSQWLPRFLEQVWNKTDNLYHIWYENLAMIQVCQSDAEATQKIFTNAQHWIFNAYIGGRKGQRLWRPADLLVHFAGVYDTKMMKNFIGAIQEGKIPRIKIFDEAEDAATAEAAARTFLSAT